MSTTSTDSSGAEAVGSERRPRRRRPSLPASILKEIAILRRAIRDVSSLPSVIKIPARLQWDEEIIFLTYRQLLEEEKSESDIFGILIRPIRYMVIAYLNHGLSLLLRDLIRHERIYLRKLKDYKKNTYIAFSAKGERQLRRERTSASQAITRLKNMKAPLALTTSVWRKHVFSSLASLESNKAILQECARQMMEWDKYVDDRARLRIAVRALFVATVGIMLNLGFNVFRYFEDKGDENIDKTRLGIVVDQELDHHTRNLTLKAQIALAEKGYDPGPLDGFHGSRTTAALKRFQTANRLVSTGLLDTDTMCRLGIIIGVRYSCLDE